MRVSSPADRKVANNERAPSGVNPFSSDLEVLRQSASGTHMGETTPSEGRAEGTAAFTLDGRITPAPRQASRAIRRSHWLAESQRRSIAYDCSD